MKQSLFVVLFMALLKLSYAQELKLNEKLSKENTLTLVIFRHLKPLDWNTPKGLLDSLSRAMTSFQARRVEHSAVIINCKDRDVVVSSTQMVSLQSFYDAVLKEHLGFGSLLKVYPGREENSTQLISQINQDYSDSDKMLYHSFEISKTECHEMMSLYQSKKEMGKFAHYSVANQDHAENCFASSLAYLKIVARYKEVIKQWEREIIIPYGLIGTPTEQIPLAELSKKIYRENLFPGWEKERNQGVAIKIYDPELIKNWIKGQKSFEENKTAKNSF